jgi:putative endonuclease
MLGAAGHLEPAFNSRWRGETRWIDMSELVPETLSTRSHRPDGERQARVWRGHVAEWIAAVFLILRGYRILARRHRTPFGEVDIIARRGRRLAFVEVKRRPTLREAAWSFTPTQGERIGRAAEHFMRAHPRYRGHEMGMDLILIGRHGWPDYLPNTFHAPWDSWRRR